ncbi:MAG TPA: sulfite exporter TauE/SafE family protein [Gemmatimonadales bacterium]|nr:sulfite exporter TauE/SafE family protein [Gemmatimonadales bacterium]
MNWVLVSVIGLTAGVVSGLFGVGGAVVIVPGLVLLLGLPQHTANGTSLAALVVPAGILIGALEYYKRGQVNVPYAAVIAVGLLLGALVGAKLAGMVDELALRRGFAVFLMVVALRLFVR